MKLGQCYIWSHWVFFLSRSLCLIFFGNVNWQDQWCCYCALFVYICVCACVCVCVYTWLCVCVCVCVCCVPDSPALNNNVYLICICLSLGFCFMLRRQFEWRQIEKDGEGLRNHGYPSRLSHVTTTQYTPAAYYPPPPNNPIKTSKIIKTLDIKQTASCIFLFFCPGRRDRSS